MSETILPTWKKTALRMEDVGNEVLNDDSFKVFSSANPNKINKGKVVNKGKIIEIEIEGKPSIIMTTAEAIIAIVVSLTTVMSSAAIGIRWLVRHYFDDIKHELKPNSGASMKDQVNRMESDILDLKSQNSQGELYHEKLDNKIDHLTKLFVEYVARQK